MLEQADRLKPMVSAAHFYPDRPIDVGHLIGQPMEWRRWGWARERWSCHIGDEFGEMAIIAPCDPKGGYGYEIVAEGYGILPSRFYRAGVTPDEAKLLAEQHLRALLAVANERFLAFTQSRHMQPVRWIGRDQD